jgi:hypothetical protein
MDEGAENNHDEWLCVCYTGVEVKHAVRTPGTRACNYGDPVSA